ncbi:serine protease [Streptomyces sp. NPDC006798]|uniref:S1 family peptidase n=1 Tax=Streptomyces sp. NPDC006798 TaxID=3155462 RepID=UPI00340823FF
MHQTMRQLTSRRITACLAAVAASGIVLTTAPSASAIVGGTPVPNGKYSYVVQLEQRNADGTWGHFCGAALIDARVVATAAHCSKWVESGHVKMRVVLGRADMNSPRGTVVNDDAFTVYSHPGFSTSTNTDLGLIVLDRPVRQRAASLPPAGSRPEPGRVLQAAGWGRTVLEDADSKPSRMREAALPVTEFDTEGGSWDKEFLCAGTEQKRVGPGDSGGPLFAPAKSGKAVIHGLVTGDTNTCTGLFTNLADPAIWQPFQGPLASHGLSHVLPKGARN